MSHSFPELVGLLVPWWILLVHASKRSSVSLGGCLLAAVFVGFVGAVCQIELRRYGWLDASPESVSGLGFRFLDLLRFGLAGATAAWAVQVASSRLITALSRD